MREGFIAKSDTPPQPEMINNSTLVLLWGKTREDIIESAKSELKLLLANIDETHGYSHAVSVMNHTIAALTYHQGNPISEEEQTIIILASLCHDADDRKYWKDSHNAHRVLEVCSNGYATFQQYCFFNDLIGLVSCSSNGNNIPQKAIDKPELLYPRFSDRLEALGEIGLKRTFLYSIKTGMPMFITDKTQRATTEKELWEIASHERFSKYAGISESMIDHFYDKLLRISILDTSNPYYLSEAANRSQIMIDVCLYYGETGTIHPIFSSFNPEQ